MSFLAQCAKMSVGNSIPFSVWSALLVFQGLRSIATKFLRISADRIPLYKLQNYQWKILVKEMQGIIVSEQSWVDVWAKADGKDEVLPEFSGNSLQFFGTKELVLKKTEIISISFLKFIHFLIYWMLLVAFLISSPSAFPTGTKSLIPCVRFISAISKISKVVSVFLNELWLIKSLCQFIFLKLN